MHHGHLLVCPVLPHPNISTVSHHIVPGQAGLVPGLYHQAFHVPAVAGISLFKLGRCQSLVEQLGERLTTDQSEADTASSWGDRERKVVTRLVVCRTEGVERMVVRC